MDWLARLHVPGLPSGKGELPSSELFSSIKSPDWDNDNSRFLLLTKRTMIRAKLSKLERLAHRLDPSWESVVCVIRQEAFHGPIYSCCAR
jgi:hypothetical protein